MELRLDALTVQLPAGHLLRDGRRVGALTELEAALLAYLSARPGQAIARETLHAEVWGYAETVRSRAVDFTMSRLRKKIEADPSEPRFLHTVRGAGYRFEPGRAEVAATRPAPPPDAFVGRDAELRRLRELFAGEARLVTVLGMGGVGKTRLVLEFLTDVDDVAAVDLSAVASRSGLLDAVATALALPAQGDVAVRIGERLGQGTLLVLDDVDQTVAEAASLVGGWLRSGARILVTSRERLRVAGEHLVEVGPLSDVDAAELFRRRSEAIRGPLADDDGPAVDALVAQLEGWPLAVELAAARTRLVSPRGLLERFDPLALAGRRRDRPERHRSVEAVLAQTMDQLGPDETAALTAVSLLPFGASLDALERMLDRDPIDAVADLADRALVRVDESYGAVRVWTAGLVGRWLRANAASRPELLEARLAWAADHAWERFEGIRCARAWRESDDLERSTVHLVWTERQPGRNAVRLGIGLAAWWTRRGSWTELDGMADAVVADAEGLGDAELLHEARLRWIDTRRLTGRGVEALPLARRLWAEGSRRAGFLLGAIHRRLGNVAEASAVLEAVAAGEDLSAARASTVLALLSDAGKDSGRAVALARRGLQLVERHGAEAYITPMAVNLAVSLRHHGELDEARTVLERAEAHLPQSGSPRLRASLLHERGQVEIDAGRLAEGERYGRAELATYRAHGDRAGTAWPLGNLGITAAERGDLGEARRLLGEALEIHRAVGNRAGEVATLANLGIVDLLAADKESAAERLAAALSMQAGLDRYVPVIQGFLDVARGCWTERELEGPPQDLRLLRRLTGE